MSISFTIPVHDSIMEKDYEIKVESSAIDGYGIKVIEIRKLIAKMIEISHSDLIFYFFFKGGKETHYKTNFMGKIPYDEIECLDNAQVSVLEKIVVSYP